MSASCLFFMLSLILTLLLCVRLERAPPKLVLNHAHFFHVLYHRSSALLKLNSAVVPNGKMFFWTFSLKVFFRNYKTVRPLFFLFFSFFILNSWFKSFSEVHHVYGTMLFSFHTGLESDSRHTSHTATALSCKENLYL